MKLFLLLLLCIAGLASVSGTLFQFGSMIKYKTGKSPQSYIGYGCSCGLGGSKQPVDATDRCCHAHDCCYKRISFLSCRPKLVKYNVSKQGGQITCGKRQHKDLGLRAKGRPASVTSRRECFQRTARSYNNGYKNYLNTFCKGRAPSC